MSSATRAGRGTPPGENPSPATGTDLSRARLGLAGRGLRNPSAGRRLARGPGPGRAASSPPRASEPGPGAAAAHPTVPAGPASTKGGGGARPGRGCGRRRIARARRALEGCSRRGDNAARPGRAPAAASAGGGARRGRGMGAGRGLREAGRRRGSRAARFLCAAAPAPPRALWKARGGAGGRLGTEGFCLRRRAPRHANVRSRPVKSPPCGGGLPPGQVGGRKNND